MSIHFISRKQRYMSNLLVGVLHISRRVLNEFVEVINKKKFRGKKTFVKASMINKACMMQQAIKLIGGYLNNLQKAVNGI